MRIVLAFALSIVLIVAGGCGSSSGGAAAPTASPPSSTSAAESPSPSPSAPDKTGEPAATPLPGEDIADQIANMTLDEKIGQLLLIGLDGKTISPFAKKMIQDNKVGGFILYKDNIKSAAQTAALLNSLKAANKENSVPLWLSLDQEGGKVSRLPAEINKFPSAHELGALKDIEHTKDVGHALGLSVKALGFNMDFAPVLDIDSNPDNPVIGDRSFGSDADTVINHGLAMMHGISEAGVTTVVKHFPGHGDTSVDSHYALPVVGKSLDELGKLELLPFVEAVGQNADAVMVAHLLIPALDKDYPTSISDKAINGLLRSGLGYNGVVVTDDLTMGGLLQDNEIGEAAVRAVQAGADLLLVGHDEKLQQRVLAALSSSVKDGSITEDRLDESLHRLLALKQKYKLQDAKSDTPDINAINEVISEALNNP
ncbi:beta-N-acetylhexosaminidase [Paenibacillus sp. CAU 1782]